MARRGKFGRLPRSQPSVASTLAAIAREYQRQRDQNLMEAWEKGGTFEGQQATDELVLEHWRNRMEGVDKNDPLHDTYENAVLQYEYAIAESKMATAYAQEKVTDLEMAGFYKKWAAKVPRNSEFWRVLQRDAAQFMRAAKAKAKASNAQAVEELYKTQQLATQRKYERGSDYLMNVFRGLAQGNALVGVASDLSEFDPRDPEAMLRLVDMFSPGYTMSRTRDDSTVLYIDALTREPVTIGSVKAQLAKLDPNFDGRVNMDYVSRLLEQKQQGVATRLKRAEATGHAADTNNLRQEQAYIAELGRQVAAWPTATSYQHYRDGFLSVWENPTATPLEKLAAWNTYAQKLTTLANEPGLDTNTRSRLIAEVTGDASAMSLSESFTGLEDANTTTTGSGRTGDIAATQASLAQFQMEVEEVAKNPGMVMWTTGVRDDQTGAFIPQAGGPVIGAATLEQINNVSPVPAIAVMAPQGQGQQPVTIMVTGVNVDTGITRNAAGDPVETAGNMVVGQVYDVVIGGYKVRTYAFRGADGKTYYSTEPPWGDNVRAHEGKGGISLDLSPFLPHQGADGKWVMADGSPADPFIGTSGINLVGVKGEQRLVIDPMALALSTDPARAKAGIDPMTDFFSPTLAALMSLPRGSETLTQLKDNRQFKALLEYDAFRAAGFQQDPATGAWVPGSGDQALLDRYMTQATLATNLPEAGAVTSFVRDAFHMFLRGSTLGTFDVGAKASPRGPTPLPPGASMGGWNPAQLPADAARGTGFDALAQAFEAGTNMLRQLTGQQGGTQIKLAQQFTLPSMGGFSPVKPTTAPSATAKPTTVGANPVVPAVTTTPVTTTVPLGGAPGAYRPPPTTNYGYGYYDSKQARK